MAAGRFVFPVVMVLFILFFVGFVVSSPAIPADPTNSRLLRIREGDSVLLEVTGYYGEPGKGNVFFSTQEERAGQLPMGPVAPQLQTTPVTYHLRGEGGSLDPFLIGHRTNDSFTTDRVPAAQAFGDWTENVTFARTLAQLPRNVTFDASTQLGPGQTFNLTEYLAFWKEQGDELSEGKRWKCEGPALWDCEVVDINPAQNSFSFRRLPPNGAQYPVTELWGSLPTGGNMNWNFSVQPATNPDEFSLRLDPPVGTRFQLRSGVGALRAGTYEITRLDDENAHARYSAVTASDPALVGFDVYYDLVVVRITRAETTV